MHGSSLCFHWKSSFILAMVTNPNVACATNVHTHNITNVNELTVFQIQSFVVRNDKLKKYIFLLMYSTLLNIRVGRTFPQKLINVTTYMSIREY